MIYLAVATVRHSTCYQAQGKAPPAACAVQEGASSMPGRISGQPQAQPQACVLCHATMVELPFICNTLGSSPKPPSTLLLPPSTHCRQCHARSFDARSSCHEGLAGCESQPALVFCKFSNASTTAAAAVHWLGRLGWIAIGPDQACEELRQR